MPPVRRRRAGPQQRQVAANYANQPSIQDLQQQCLEKGLSRSRSSKFSDTKAAGTV